MQPPPSYNKRLLHNCFRAGILRFFREIFPRALRPAPRELVEKQRGNLTKKIKSNARNELCNGLNKALITGATSGLGKAMAQFLEEKGIECIKTGRNTDTLSVDLSKKEERKTLLEHITKEKPDLIINSAGFGLYGPSVELSIQEQLDMIEVNVAALVEISLHSAKELIKANKRGTILNISSAGAFLPFPNLNLYASSKAFVNHFSLALDAELRPHGIRVLCACPGQIVTEFRLRASKGHSPRPEPIAMSPEEAVAHLWKQIEKEIPLYVFNWKTKLLVAIAKCLPRKVLERILTRKIDQRRDH